MKKTVIILIIGVTAALTSCSGGYKAMVTTNKVGTKVGIDKKTVWFGIGGVDLGAAPVAKKAGITRIATVETFVQAGFLHVSYYTKVTGE